MDSIIVLSLRKNAEPAPEGYTLVRVDRENKKLGNEHKLRDNSPEERTRVISEFRKDLDKSRKENGEMWQAIEDLADRVQAGEKLGLQCWCKPKACHADIIKSAVIFVLRQRRHPIPGQQDLNL